MPRSPVPDLGTLRSICQGEKVRQDRRPWYVFSRRVSIGITWVLLKVLDATLGLRVSEEQESEGLDLAQHGEHGYNS